MSELEDAYGLNELKSRLKEWKAILGLSDWDIKLEWSGYEIACRGDQAQVFFVVGDQTATIKILHPEARPPDSSTPYQDEDDLMHELLHLVFVHQRQQEGTIESVVFEQALHKTGRAIVRLYYEARFKNSCAKEPDHDE